MAQDTVNYEPLDEPKHEIAYYRFNFYCNIKSEDDDGPLNITPYVRFIYTECDYEIQKFPLIKVKMKLPKKVYKLMYENQEKVLFTLKVFRYKRVSKLSRDNDMFLTMEEQPMDELEYFKDVLLKPIGRPFKKIEQDDDKGNLKEGGNDLNVLDGNDGNMQDYSPIYDLDLYLFKKEHLLFNKQLNSYVFHNTNLASVILFLIQRNCQPKEADIYVGKLDNNKNYEQIIIPPLNFFDALDYLQRVYGLYANGLQVFADFKNLFIEDICKVVKIADRKRGLSRASVEFYSTKDKDTDLNRSNLIWLYKPKNIYIIRSSMRPTFTSRNSEEQEINGEKVTFTSSSQQAHFTGSIWDTRMTHKENNEQMKENFIWNPYSHDYPESEYRVTRNRSKFLLKAEYPTGCIEAFILNRQYQITDYSKKNFEGGIIGKDDKRYNVNGEYKIVSNHMLLTNKGGPYKEPMDCTVSNSVMWKKIDIKDECITTF